MKIEQLDPMSLKPDPGLEELLPIDRKTPEFEAFKLSVEADSIHDPIHVFWPDGRQSGIVWSGRRRLFAAQIYGLPSVPCIVHKDAAERDLVIFTDLIHKRDTSKSSRVWLTRDLWVPILQRSKAEKHKNFHISHKSPNREISRLDVSTLLCMAEMTGIDLKYFSQCERVIGYFEADSDFEAEWLPRIKSGEASFWNIISAA